MLNLQWFLHNYFHFDMHKSGYIFKAKGKIYDLRTPIIMGILNITPDSFFSLSRYKSDRSILQQVENFLIDGASIIDFGGYSTRSQAEAVSADEEMKRLSETLDIVLKKFPEITFSVDTFRSPVARMVVQDYGAAIINDISGGTLDPLMFETIAQLKVAYVLMHTRGTPQNMQENTDYNDLIAEVMHFLGQRVAQLRMMGVNDILIDPGFGFAKTLEQNYQLLKNLHAFKTINAPLLAGVSRKSMIYKLLGNTPEKALNGTTSVHILALLGGAKVLRVHDVKEAAEAIKIFEAYQQS